MTQTTDDFEIPNQFKRNSNKIDPKYQAILDEMDRLRAENEALRTKQAKSARTITWKIQTESKDGKPATRSLSVYGLGRFPVTLYASQWLKLFEVKQEIEEFIDANKSNLAWKE